MRLNHFIFGKISAKWLTRIAGQDLGGADNYLAQSGKLIVSGNSTNARPQLLAGKFCRGSDPNRKAWRRSICYTSVPEHDASTTGLLEAVADVGRLLLVGRRQSDLKERHLTMAAVKRTHHHRRPGDDSRIFPLHGVEARHGPVE